MCAGTAALIVRIPSAILLAVREQWHSVRSLLVLNAAAKAAAQWTATLPHAAPAKEIPAECALLSPCASRVHVEPRCARDAATTGCALRWCSTQHACKAADGSLPRLGVPLTARAVPRVSTRDRRGLRHSTAVHRAGLACSYRRYAAAACVVTYYPPAPLVVATTASGARLTDMSESAMVRSLTRRWRGFGFLDLALALVHGGSCISVACRLHGACCTLLAACCMHHAASGAQGEWLDLVCGGNLADFPRGFSSAVCRRCRAEHSLRWSCRTCQ